MAGGQRDSLVKKEEFRILSGCHDPPTPAAELGFAAYPRLACPGPLKRLAVIVQAAAIAHQRPAVLYRDDDSEGRDPILKRQEAILLQTNCANQKRAMGTKT